MMMKTMAAWMSDFKKDTDLYLREDNQRRNMLKTFKGRIFFSMFVICVLFGFTGCFDEDEEFICDDYCAVNGDCQAFSNQQFSLTECVDTCTVSLEKKESVNCGEQMTQVYECYVNLPCNAWSDSGDACAYQIESLASCMGGTSY